VTKTPVVFAPAGPPGNDLNAPNRDRRSIGGAGTACSITTVDPGGGAFASPRIDGATEGGSATLAAAGAAFSSAGLAGGVSACGADPSNHGRSGMILAVFDAPSPGWFTCEFATLLNRSFPPDDIWKLRYLK